MTAAVSVRSIVRRVITPLLVLIALVAGPLASMPAQAAEGGRISGTVTLVGSESAGSAYVQLYTLEDYGDGPQWSYADGTGVSSTGSYSFDVPDGSYRLGFQASRYVNQFWNGAATLDSATTVTVAGANRPGIDASLIPMPTIGGTLTGPGGASAKYVGVTVWSYDGSSGSWNQVTTEYTDSRGVYAASVPPNGSYRLELGTGSGTYKREFYDDKATIEQAVSIPVGTANVTGKDAVLALNPTISGVVSKAGGVGVPYAQVQLYTFDFGFWQPTGAATADRDGAFSVGAAPGTYRIGFRDFNDAYRSEFWNDKATVETGTSLTLTSTGLTGISPQLAANPVISGTVSNAAGALRGTRVALYRGYSDGDGGFEYQLHREVQTATNGTYSFSVEPGSYKVGFSKSGYIPEYWNDKGTLDAATPISVASADVSSRDAVLAAQPAVTGVVTSGGAPLSSVSVSALDEDGNYVAGTGTRSDGTYSLKVDPGTYRIEFAEDDGTHATRYWDNAATLEAATPVSVPLTGVANVNAALPANPVVTGQATDVTGQPVEDVQVTAYPSTDETEVAQRVETGPDGKFRLPLPAGTYKIGFSNRAFKPQFLNGKTTFAAADPVVVPTDGLTGKNVVLVAATAIKGKVTKAGGAGVSTRVTAYRADDEAPDDFDSVSSVRTKSDGTYVLPLPAGTYRLRFAAADSLLGEYWDDAQTLGSATDIVLTSASDVTGRNAQLSAPTSISGTVRGTGNVALPTGEVTLYRLYTDGFGSYYDYVDDVRADTSGAYSFSAAPGTYKLGFAADGYRTEYWNDKASLALADSFVVGSTAVTGKDAVLTTRSASISGTVTGPSGPVTGGLNVTAYQLHEDEFDSYWEDVQTTTTDATGAYRISIDPGTYRLEFFDDEGDLAAEYYQNQASIDDAENVVVPAGGVTGRNAVLAALPSVTGTVTRTGAAPAPGVTVTAYVYEDFGDDGEWYERTSTTTKADGSYRLNLPVGTYRLGFSDHEGFLASEFYADQPTVEAAQNVVVGAGGLTGRNAQLATASLIKGKVTGTSNAALAGAEVTAYRLIDDEDGSYWSDAQSVETATDGTYALPVGNGTWRIGFAAPEAGYSEEFFDNQQTVEAAQSIVVAGADVTGKNAQLTAGSGIRGVADADDGVRVSAYRFVAAEDRWQEYASTFASGDYGLELPPGTYRVRFVEDSDDGATGDRVYWNNASSFAASQDVVVTAGSFVSGISQVFGMPVVGSPRDLPAITGSPVVGGTLTAQEGVWTPAPVQFAYQWQRDGSSITGATNRTYVPTAADLGKRLAVRITGSKTGFTSQVRYSDETLPVTASTTPTTPPTTVPPVVTPPGATPPVVGPPTPPSIAKVNAAVTVKGKGGKKKATLTITVRASGVTPTGKVTIKLRGKTLKTVTLKNGRATVKLSKLKKGKKAFTVVYSGDARVNARTVSTKKIAIK